MRVEYFLGLMPKFLTQGKDLFIDSMPDETMKGVVILPYLGGGKIDYELMGWRNGDSFQVVVRHPDVNAAYELAQTISDALHIETATTFLAASANIKGKDIEVQFLRPRADPIVFPRPLTKWWEVSINFDVCYRFLG